MTAPTAASPAATCTKSSWTSTPCCGAGGLLPLRQLEPEVRRHRQLRALAAVQAGQRQICHPIPTPSQPLQLRLAHRTRHPPTHRKRPILETCACLTMNDVGEPCAGEPHARFDRGPLATRNQTCGGRWSWAGALRNATTTARSGPQPQQRTVEPAAYLTASAIARPHVRGRAVSDAASGSSPVRGHPAAGRRPSPVAVSTRLGGLAIESDCCRWRFGGVVRCRERRGPPL